MANNGIAVIITYATTANIDETENMPIWATLLGLLVFVGLMIFFKILSEVSFSDIMVKKSALLLFLVKNA